MDKKIYYTMQDIDVHLNSIIHDMWRQTFKPKHVIAVARGGLIPGTYLSHYFDVPMIILNVSLRDNKVLNSNNLDEIVKLLESEQKLLLVDDICDNGHTLRYVWDQLYNRCPNPKDDGETWTTVERNLHTAVLIHNEGEDNFSPDHVGESINKTENPSWIVFPWEEWWSV